MAPSPYKLKHRSGLLHLRSKPLQQRRHTMGINPVKKAVKLATTRKKRSPRGLVRPVKQREPIIDWDVDNDEVSCCRRKALSGGCSKASKVLFLRHKRQK